MGCGAHADTFRIHWSSATAMMIRQPTANSCQSTSTPASVEAVAEDADDQRADQRADDRAAAAEQAGAADHHRGDAVEIGGLAGLRADRADPPDQGPAAERADHAGSDIDREQDAVGADAGEPRRVGIVADGIEMASEGGAVEHVPGQRHEREQEEGAVGEAGRRDVDRRSQPLQQGRGLGRRPASGWSRRPNTRG